MPLPLRGNQTPRRTHPGAGRGWKLTPNRIARMAAAVRAGNYSYVAAQHAGIGKGSYYRYLALGQRVLEREIDAGRLDPVLLEDITDDQMIEDRRVKRNRLADALYALGDVPDHEVLCAQMWDEITRAEAEAEMTMVTSISQAGQGPAGDWRARAWLLARRHPDRWKEHTGMEVSGPDGGPINVSDPNVRAALMDPEARAQAMSLLALVVPASTGALDREDVIDVESTEEYAEDLVSAEG